MPQRRSRGPADRRGGGGRAGRGAAAPPFAAGKGCANGTQCASRGNSPLDLLGRGVGRGRR